MAFLVNHPGKYLRDDAAASLARLERDLGVITVNSAGRSVAEQRELINRWNRGGSANRPPFLYKPQVPAELSYHVRNGNIAIDTSHISLMLSRGAAYGWFRPYSGDPVHFEYDPRRDTKRGSLSPAGGSAKPIPVVPSSKLIKERQQFLIKYRGEEIDADGKLGDRTKMAIKRYQQFLRKYGYTGVLDGKWGQGTQNAHAKYWSAVKPKPAGRPTIRLGNQGRAVKELQLRLRGQFGFSKLSGDGKFGQATKDAVIRFQVRYGLRADGVVGTNTWKKLGL
jgi:peptidoglycan hydrolase-like protein with peptidoglycan-binding domain